MRRLARTPLASLPLILIVLLSGACQAPERPPPRSDPTQDPRLVELDHGAPGTDFDGEAGSLLLGEGWGSYEKYTSRLDRLMLKEPVAFAWALDGASQIWFERPREREIDFYAVLMPFPHPEERQELILSVGGRELGRRELEDGWQKIRIPLPESAIGRGFRTLRLTFRYAISPKEVGEGQDERRLSAAFRRIALVPRGVEDPASILGANRLETTPEGATRLRLARRAGVTFPLPADTFGTLHLGRLADGARPARWEECQARFELLGGRELFRGTAQEARRAGDVTFRTPAGPPGRLRLSLAGCGRAGDDPRGSIEIPLAPDFLSLRPRSDARRTARPHIFIYMIDTLRADALSVYGSPRPTSPRIEELARDAVIYDDVWSASAWTLPSVTSMITGVYPDRHRVSLGLDQLSEESFPTLAERLRGEGYVTVAVSQSFIISRLFGLHLGFDDFYLSDQLGGTELRSQEARSYLLQWLLHRWDGETPIFAYLHTVDPHAPYLPVDRDRRFADAAPKTLREERYAPAVFSAKRYAADSPEVEQLRARYDGEVAYADREFGHFLDLLRHLGLYNDSLIVLTSDHGEEFGEHGGFDHGRTMYEEMLQVPLLVKYPRSEGAGTRVTSRVSTVDILPTVLRWAGGAPVSEEIDGQILPPFESVERRYAFSEVKTVPARNLAAVHFRAFQIGSLKCIESVSGTDQYHREIPPWQGFDLAEDPTEKNPLSSGDPRLERCREALSRWRRSREETQAEPASSLEGLDEAARQRLRAVGYIE